MWDVCCGQCQEALFGVCDEGEGGEGMVVRCGGFMRYSQTLWACCKVFFRISAMAFGACEGRYPYCTVLGNEAREWAMAHCHVRTYSIGFSLLVYSGPKATWTKTQ